MQKKTIVLLGFVVLKFILQYQLIDGSYDLQRDEYLHLDQGKHLAWGYQSVPPVTSWISFLISRLGDSIFWVKFFPALFGALTLLVVWKTVAELNGGMAAMIMATVGILFSALLRLNTLFQPNSLDVLCWTTLFYFVIKHWRTEKPAWLYLGAAVFALGILNKYNIAFALIGLLPAVLLTSQRNIFFKKELYGAALLVFVLILPHLLWQYENHFPVWRHMHELASRQLVHVNRFDFLKAQLLFFAGSLPVILIGLYGLLFHPPFQKFKAFFWSFFFTLIVFTALKAKDYYAIGLYPIYIALGAVYIQHLATGRKKVWIPIVAILPIVFFIPMYQYAFPNKTPAQIIQQQENYRALGMLRWEDGQDHALPQDFADMLGWRELAHKVDSAYRYIDSPDSTLVLCDNYGQAGAINFYSQQGIRAVTFNADYIDWFELDKVYRHLIRVKNREERSREWQETAPYFKTAVLSDSITAVYAREYGTTIFTFMGATVNINARIEAELKEVKSGW
jgi:4-amino-4-deoxy-L-arabinose transferase-like glycosyltransferase